MAFKTLYNRLAHRDEPFKFEKPSLTLQEPKEDCDINHIVELYCGVNPQYNPLLHQPFFEGEDAASLPSDLLEAYEIIDDINQRFSELPSRLRDELGNSPVSMLQWICNPSNKERGVELGIFKQPTEPSNQGSGNSVVNAKCVSVSDNSAVTE